MTRTNFSQCSAEKKNNNKNNQTNYRKVFPSETGKTLIIIIKRITERTFRLETEKTLITIPKLNLKGHNHKNP